MHFENTSLCCFLRSLFFDPEGGGYISLRNVWLSPSYTALQPENNSLFFYVSFSTILKSIYRWRPIPPVYCLSIFIYFIYDLFRDAISNSAYTASNYRMISV
jgi:hypothetical protein